VKYAFIEEHHRQFSLAAMCRVLDVSRSGYYDWLGRDESQRAVNNRVLLEHVRRIHVQFRQRYGIVKCWKQLNAEGIVCGRDRVARLRRTHGIYSKRRRRFVITTRSRHTHWIAPNRLERNFAAEKPDRVWVGDVTFVATRSGWLFLAILIDLYSRKVVGWSMSNSNNGQLVQDSLNMAIQQRQPQAGLIHHTDRGSTYATQSYRDTLKTNGMVSSMSRKGDCWDNAVAESFFANLKNELIYWCDFNNRNEARSAIFEYIEVFYNRQRLHQTLGYITPDQFESMNCVA
jgi:putative transposase